MTLSDLVGEIDGGRQQGNLSSAIRLFVLDYFRSRAVPSPTPGGFGHERVEESRQ
jgi:predicted DNA-binding ribbon-helix-helix protein